MRDNIDKRELGNMISSLAHYEALPNYFLQLDPKQSEVLKAFWNKSFPADFKYSDLATWNSVNIHVVSQMWSNTSGGWETIGGAAMTESYTTIIENRRLRMICVYYGGTLAYIAEIDDKLDTLIKGGYSRLPGIGSLTKRLTVIYKKSR